MKNKKVYISVIINVLIVVMEIIALVISFTQHGTGMFQFYTEDSNIFALFTSLIFVIYTINFLMKNIQIPQWVKVLKYISTCCLTVTFLVVIFVLAPMAGANGYTKMLLDGTMLYHHLLCPVLAILSFILLEASDKITYKHTIYAIIPTIIYAIIAIVLNILKIMKGPYPFLLVYKQPIYMSVIWCIVIVGGAYLIAYIMKKIVNKINEKYIKDKGV